MHTEPGKVGSLVTLSLVTLPHVPLVTLLLVTVFPRAGPGADIRSVCTEAGMFAIRERRKVSPPGGGEMRMYLMEGVW